MEFRKVLANELSKKMREDQKNVVLDADLAAPDGIAPLFSEFPDRCFQVGIAEANMAGLSAGLSAYGYKPVMVTFTPFATRRIFDQITVSIAYAKQNVKIIGTDPGITAELNGGTHMSFEDVALMRSLPDMLIYDAVDDVQFALALPRLLEYSGNVYIRMPRKNRPTVFAADYKFNFGKADLLTDGDDVTIVATGTMVYEAKIASEILREKGISAEVISVNFIKPLDEEMILKSVKKTNCVVVCENHNLKGGLYSAVAELICSRYPVPTLGVGIDDEFGQVGTYQELLNYYKMTANDIVQKVEKVKKITRGEK